MGEVDGKINVQDGMFEEKLRKSCDELELRVRKRTAELEARNERLKTENLERMRNEQLVKFEEARLEALLHLSRFSKTPLKEIAGFTLE